MDATPATVTAVRWVGSDTIALELETPDEFDAFPGQFVKLSLTVDDEERSRFYTISSPDVHDTFELTIGIDPEGEVAPHLAELDPGATVTITGPFGSDFYEGEARVVVLAGGPGVGPAVGIGEAALADGNEVAIVYQDDAPVHEKRLSWLSASGATVFIVTEHLEGAISAVLSRDERDEQLFIYGFADFLDDALDAVIAAGGDPSTAKTENFG